MSADAGPRAHPRHGWVAAVLPDAARRIRVVDDDALAATLAVAGADVAGGEPEVVVGPVDRRTADAPVAVVPLASLGQLGGPRPARLARRLAAALAVRVRAARARRSLRRLYPQTGIVRWDVGQPVRAPGAPRPRRAVDRLPRAAVVIGSRREPDPTILEEALRAASAQLGSSIGTGAPVATGGGTLVVLTSTHVVRVAAGPGREHLRRQHAALDELWARTPPELVAGRLPRPLAAGERRLGGWLLEDRLPGAVPDAVAGRLLDDCADFLVCLHGCASSEVGPSLVGAADTVNALSGGTRDDLRRLGERLDERLAGLPRGFGHGDFWRRNLLVDGGRLAGVVDWEHAGAGRLPVLDLLQLVATQPRYDGRGITSVVVGGLLPWARAGGDDTVRRYGARLGLDLRPPLLEDLVLAFWLDRLARQLDKCGDLGGSPRWAGDHVDPVLIAGGIGRP